MPDAPLAAARARDWLRAGRAAVCDVQEPWAHGTILRATHLPQYFDYNLLRVEDEPGMSAADLAALADEALAGLTHRRIDFEDAAVAAPRLDGLRTLGYDVVRLVVMRHEGPAPRTGALAVDEVPYDAVAALREAWYREDFPDQDPGGYFGEARDVAMTRRTRVLAVRRDGEPVGFAQLEQLGDGAEISQVYVGPEHRGGGLGTALTSAAIAAAGPVRDLWIVAEDEGRPKQLYGRLGFRVARVVVQVTRWPPPAR